MAKGTFWVGGGSDNKWSNSQNWSGSSGGAGGHAPPGALGIAVFDANSGTGQVEIDSGAICKQLTCSNPTTGDFAGEFVGSAGLQIDGHATLSASMTWSHTGLVTFGGLGGNLNTNGITLPSVEVNMSGTLTFFSDVNTSGSWTVTAGTVNQNGFLLNGA